MFRLWSQEEGEGTRVLLMLLVFGSSKASPVVDECDLGPSSLFSEQLFRGWRAQSGICVLDDCHNGESQCARGTRLACEREICGRMSDLVVGRSQRCQE